MASHAQDAATKHADDPVAAEARRHYEEGTKAFNLGEYPRAIAEFKAAYNAKPDPSLLYNIGQSFRLQGDAGQAIFFYKSFLRNMPATPNRKEVEGHIRALEKQAQVEEQRKEAAAVPVVTAPPVVAVPVTPAAPVVVPPPPVETAPPVVVKPIESAPSSTTPPSLETQPAPAAPTVDLSPRPSDEPPPPRPIYKKWWFWTGIGAVLLVGGAVAVAARNKPPSTSFGLFDPTFIKP
ncbi:MAG TPA: tetratricopeptide repeat protein [Polyangia bacterium]